MEEEKIVVTEEKTTATIEPEPPKEENHNQTNYDYTTPGCNPPKAKASFFSEKKNILLVAMAAVVVVLLIIMIASGNGGSNSNGSMLNNGHTTEKESEFCTLVSETQELIDDYADDIYRCWYNYVYEDEYSSVDLALLDAYVDNIENITVIEENTERIKELYKEIKDGDLSDEAKEVMQAYNEYYSFVLEVSGSFNSYSAGKETLKKELASAVKNLSFELE